MYTLTANARDGENMRPLHGDGAVEKYVAERIASKTAQHRSVRKWLQTPDSPWEDWGTLGRGTREEAPLVEGPNVENPTANTPQSAQDQDQSHQGTEVGEPKEQHQEQMLLEELQHAHWDPSSSPGQWDYDNQDWGTPQSHAAQEAAPETTRDEWDMNWETVVDKDTGDVSMRVYAVKDKEEIPLSLTTLLPLLPHVEEGFYVAQGGTRACSLREAKAKVPTGFQGRMRTFMLMLYPYICEGLADKPNDAQFWDNPGDRALKSQFVLPQEALNALGLQRELEAPGVSEEDPTAWE
eukprot:gene22812-27562_t